MPTLARRQHGALAAASRQHAAATTRPLLRFALTTAALVRPPPRMSSSGAEYPALRAFLEHSSEEYHLEGPTDEMRAALLEWYGQNRRKLPWRGDPPPYNGSTAGINSARAASAPAAPAAPASTPATPVAPVSAYGVWVSEIMCQQTRVEADADPRLEPGRHELALDPLRTANDAPARREPQP